MSLSPGDRLGSYQILASIGAGGMGEVYRAHDDKLRRDVALKTLPAKFALDPERLARLRREALTLASLNHPNIASIYGLEEFSGSMYLVLELVEGEAPRGPLPLDKALEYAKQVTSALEAAHQKGIIHRDLKPDNVKVTPEGRVKVLDFGLAKAVWVAGESLDLSQMETATQFGTIAGHNVGTPPYMSPEQARGKELDQRADIWAFGCLLYELLTGKRAFQGRTLQDTIAAVLERQPDWSALPAKTPGKIRRLLGRCLEKDVNRRLGTITEARNALQRPQRKGGQWTLVAATAVIVTFLAIGAMLWMRIPGRPPTRDEWVQLTKLPDSVSQPALSPDGRLLAFIRGPGTFFGPGQVYVKVLPDGEPAQLTNDDLYKMSPAFSPDGTRIAYTTVDPQFHWDTWTVPVLGGKPQAWLRNASGLVWTGMSQILFSEVKQPPHMGIMSAEESRLNERQIYLPAPERGMAHRSYLAPDGKSVLLVEMDNSGTWLPCRIIPADGLSPGQQVGPPDGGCTFGAWSRDGKSVYLTSNAGGTFHIWRQRLPSGRPEQFTSGPTEEEGIAMAPNGQSLITAVAVRNASLWLHDARGERQISRLEGSAASPRFTPDGKKLCYLVLKTAPDFIEAASDPGELWVAELESGSSERLFPGLDVLHYDISPDGEQVVMEAAEHDGRHHIWIAPLDRHSPPQQVPNIEGSEPAFGPKGEIFYRHPEGSSSFVYQARPDGTGAHKVIAGPILDFGGLTPDGRRLVAWAPLSGSGAAAWQAFSLDDRPPLLIAPGFIGSDWSRGGRSVAFFSGPIAAGRSYIVPVPPGEDFPRIAPGGLRSEQQIAGLPGAHRVDTDRVLPGESPDVYVFVRGTTQRNLYQIPVP